MKRLILLFSFIFSCGILHSQWVQVGPAGGKVNVFAKDSSIIFAGTSMGISQSTDGGISWRQNSLTSADIISLLIKDSVILAGGGSYNGIYRSTNHGVSWSSPVLSGHVVYSIFYASSAMFAATEWNGIYKSTDYGRTWTESGLNSASVYSFASIDSIIFVGTGVMGLYYSLDTGKTWSASTLDAEVIPSLLVVGNTIYAGTFVGVYKSTDRGTTWQATSMTEPLVWTLGADGTNIYAGTQSGGVFLSSDSGTTWIHTALNNREVHGISSFDSIVFAGTNGYGIYESTDFGQTWDNKNNVGFNIRSLATDSANIYTGTSIGSIYLSPDNGLSWAQTSLSSVQASCMTAGSLDTSRYVFAGTLDGRVWLSTNTGTGWIPVLTGVTRVNGLNVSNSTGPNVYAVGSKGIYTSTDFGVTWVQTLTNTYCYSVTSSGSKVAAGTNVGIYLSTDNGSTFAQTSMDSGVFVSMASTRNTMFGGNSDGYGVYKSVDGGLTWRQTPLNDKSIVSLALAIASQGTMLFAATGDSVFESTDFGNTWTGINDGFENMNITINALACNSDYLYAGSAGQSVWRRPLPWFRGEKHINNNIPKTFSLFQNYPNPFNPATTIKFDVPPAMRGADKRNILLKIYDVLGREVVTLLDKPLQPGSYKIEWNASGFASGVYFYRLTSDDFSQVRKMVLIK